jgi:transposase
MAETIADLVASGASREAVRDRILHDARERTAARLVAGDMGTGDVAQLVGVSEATIKRWADAGQIAGTHRTPGGHRHFDFEGVVSLVIENARKRAKLSGVGAGEGTVDHG